MCIYCGLLECSSSLVQMVWSSPVGSCGNMGTHVLLVHCVNKAWQSYLMQETDNAQNNKKTQQLSCRK